MKVNEIFVSVDGEVNAFGQGGFTTFIRISGCNLACKYCDTVRAQDPGEGKEMNTHEILKEVEKMGPRKVTITGGEPFYKYSGEVVHLIQHLYMLEYDVSIETNGTADARRWFANSHSLSFVIDYKLQYPERMVFDPHILTSNDRIKIVISSADEYTHAKKVVRTILGGTKAKIYFSPVVPGMDPAVLVYHMRKDKLFNVGINLQIHKYIWPDGMEY